MLRWPSSCRISAECSTEIAQIIGTHNGNIVCLPQYMEAVDEA